MKTQVMLRGNIRLVIGMMALIVLVAIFDQRFRTGATYMILLILTIIAVANAPSQDGQNSTGRRKNGEKGAPTLDSKERKYLIFYLLNQLKKRETIEMSEIATELNISIYELTDIIKLLDKHKAVEVIYPPLHDFPIIRRGNPEKSRAYMTTIYNELAKKSLMGGEMMEEFTLEVDDYIHNMRR